jgi:hypothetical protein
MVLMAVAVFSQVVVNRHDAPQNWLFGPTSQITFLTTGTEEVECRQGIFGGATPQIRSLMFCPVRLHRIIPGLKCSKLSNKIIQKGLAFGCVWSGSVCHPGR